MLKSAFLSGEAVLNFCANNYPEPANHPKADKSCSGCDELLGLRIEFKQATWHFVWLPCLSRL